MDKNTVDPTKSIPSFYAGQSIFLTGATGFIGKVYIEKILRSCPDVREIFILMRPKKGININERLEKMLSLPLFDKLREKQSLNFKKLIPVLGDISQENFNLSVADRQMLIERVTIIIHNAASVKFNDSLKYAIFTNTRSTRDICILAENIKNLIALVYVGTAYVHLDNPFIEEKVYPPIADWRKMIKVAEILDEHNLSIFTAKCLDYIPNTYLFSKNLAESVIHEYSSSLPCAIVRPSIVTNSLKDPIPGWIDNFNGPMGLCAFGGKGLFRVAYGSNCTSQNDMPIDIVINTIILVTWKLGLTTFTPKSTFLVINCTFPEKSTSFQVETNIILKLLKKIPLEGTVWTPRVVFTKSLIIYYVLTMLLQILPAIILDLILKFSGHQSVILGLQRKAYVANHVLHHFMCNEWKFDNTNSRNLMSLISPDDREIFSIDLSDIDMTKYFRDAIIGTKKYLLHEDMNRLKAAKAHCKRVDLFVRTFKTVIIIGILSMIYKCM
ncbi:fatty acyl-CoA reductase 1-like isoform X2 [Camponotus floridanus]|uniref:fatty acyl-CoA reductase 1-like isoform X2 n=1 Tax=Camponotus floridanus TaxID=104421 RepID=UPI000DC6CF2D|nr:fatty acyl-CoA reductase 1-like isoform X2 [Camponotus floridanus]